MYSQAINEGIGTKKKEKYQKVNTHINNLLSQYTNTELAAPSDLPEDVYDDSESMILWHNIMQTLFQSVTVYV